jgi:hypothetical protein
MRHEAGIALETHPIRELIPSEPWAATHQVDDVAEHLSESAMADFDILEGDFAWPLPWTRARRALFLFTAVSEIQLLAYLQGLKDAAENGHLSIEPGFRDKKLDWVAGIRRGEQNAVSRT